MNLDGNKIKCRNLCYKHDFSLGFADSWCVWLAWGSLAGESGPLSGRIKKPKLYFLWHSCCLLSAKVWPKLDKSWREALCFWKVLSNLSPSSPSHFGYFWVCLQLFFQQDDIWDAQHASFASRSVQREHQNLFSSWDVHCSHCTDLGSLGRDKKSISPSILLAPSALPAFLHLNFYIQRLWGC